jgi:DNA-binding transcriptional LysR family regulator
MDQMRLMRDVAYHRSISKAARIHEVSQSAASQAIQELEREVGADLLDRSTRPLTVTAAGKLYVEYCRDVLRRHEEFEASLNRLKQQHRGRVRVAAIYSVGLSEMADIEERFAALYPEAELEIAYLRPERVWEAVAADMADLGLMSYAESSRDILALPWRDEEMVVAVSASHPLAAETSVVAGALEGSAFVGFDEDLPIQDQIDRYFREHRVEVDTVLRFDNIEMIKQAVSHGAGISIMPERVMRRDVEAGRLCALHLDPPELFRPVRIIHRRKRTFNEVTRGLLGLIQQDCEVAAESGAG